jgi:hypothetical protein
MKKLIKLGNTQAMVMSKILKEEWLYTPKMAKKFTMEKVDADSEHSDYYLCVIGKLETTYFGRLMYILGMEMNTK